MSQWTEMMQAKLAEIEPLLEEHWNIKLHAEQKKFICNEARQIVLHWGRKSGKTTAEIIRIALRLLYDDVKGVGLSGGIGIHSDNFTDAKEMIEAIKAILSVMGIEFTPFKERVGGNVWYGSTSRIIAPNGNRAIALPVGLTGSNVRPWSFHEQFFDEVDYMNETVMMSTAPCTIKLKGNKIYASTANKDKPKHKSIFYKAVHDPANWSVSIIWTEKTGNIPLDEILKEKANMSKSDFDREYRCGWEKGRDSIFAPGLIETCMNETKFRKPEIEKMFNYTTTMGIDLARFGKDDNVFAWAHLVEDKIYVHVKVPYGKVRLTETTRRIEKYVRRYPKIRKVVTDEGGLGSGPTDDLIEMFGTHRVIGIQNQQRPEDAEGFRRSYIKVDMYTNLIRFLERKRIVFDKDFKILRSLRSVQYRYTKNGELTIEGYDTHVAEAIVRAVFPFMNVDYYRQKKTGLKMFFIPKRDLYPEDQKPLTLRSLFPNNKYGEQTDNKGSID